MRLLKSNRCLLYNSTFQMRFHRNITVEIYFKKWTQFTIFMIVCIIKYRYCVPTDIKIHFMTRMKKFFGNIEQHFITLN